jgi:hypothetical protein
MRIKPRYWLLLGILLCLSGCSTTPMSAPDSPRPPGPIPTPQDAPVEPTFTPEVPPRFMYDDLPVHPRPRLRKVSHWRLAAEPPGCVRPVPEGDG